jgi:hypothetical protein
MSLAARWISSPLPYQLGLALQDISAKTRTACSNHHRGAEENRCDFRPASKIKYRKLFYLSSPERLCQHLIHGHTTRSPILGTGSFDRDQTVPKVNVLPGERE